MLGTMLTGKLRYHHPFMLIGAVLLTVRGGIATTLRPGASSVKWVISEILVGAGTGLGSSLPLLAVQDVLSPSDVPVGYAVALTVGYLRSSITLAVAQAVFASQLKLDIRSQLPGVNPDVITDAGATDLRQLLPTELYEQGLQIYDNAVTESWYISVVLAGAAALSVLAYKWKKMDMRDKK